MAFHSKHDFAVLCGIQPKHVSTYISRGKIIIENDLIDDQNQVNAVFIEANRSKRSPMAEENIDNNNTITPKRQHKIESEPVNGKLTKDLIEKTELEIQDRKNRIRLQNIEIQKKQGELIPTISVKSLIVHHSESIKTAYIEASENLIVIIGAKHQLTSEDIADIRRQFTGIINKAVDSAIDNSKKTLVGIVREYSIRRGVGDHG